MPTDSLASLCTLLSRLPEGYTRGPYRTGHAASGSDPRTIYRDRLTHDDITVGAQIVARVEDAPGMPSATATMFALAPDMVDALRWAEGEIERLTADYQREVRNRERTHAILTRAGIPPAGGVACDDPQCETHLQHRTHLLVSERDALRAEVAGLTAVLDAARRRGAEEERGRVVEWLRDSEAADLPGDITCLADAIERGVHLEAL
jgi:hypothetical protein